MTRTPAFSHHGVREATVITVGLTMTSYVVFVASPLADGQPLSAVVCGLLAVSVIPGLILMPAFFTFIRAIKAWPRPVKIATISLAAAGLALLHAALDVMLGQAFIRAVSPGSRSPISIGGSVVIYVWVYGMFAAVVGLMLSNLAVQHRERLLAEARDAAHQAQMAALRYQLNPHFLFNTLNAISSLIVTRDNDQAEAMMDKLSDFLRATLADDPHQFVTLEAELDTLRAYLDIERVRFGRRLQVEFECPAALRLALTPSFVLQPLVENAIKYAVAPSRSPVVIRIVAEALAGDLVVTVEDEGARALAAPAAGVGVGLANVRGRLAALHGERGRLKAWRHDRGYRCVVAWPLTMAPAFRAAAP